MTAPLEPPDPEATVEVTAVLADRLDRTLWFVFEKARQNHKFHESWNEGANGEFATCVRGDCMEAKALLGEWEWALR